MIAMNLKMILNHPLYKDENGETFVWKDNARWYLVGRPLLGHVVLDRKGPKNLKNTRKMHVTANSPWIDKRLREIKDGK